MTAIELLEMLTSQARKFRNDREYFHRNTHMHGIDETPEVAIVDAVLTGFINQIGMMQGIDYALYAKDLDEKET